MLEAIIKKDESLDVAIKSMAESTTVLCNALATTLQTVAHGASRQQTGPRPHLAHAGVIVQPQHTQYGYNFSDFGASS